MFGESEEMNHETKWKGPHRQLNISHDARNHRLPKYRRKKRTSVNVLRIKDLDGLYDAK